jgi:hypothetical protein
LALTKKEIKAPAFSLRASWAYGATQVSVPLKRESQL